MVSDKVGRVVLAVGLVAAFLWLLNPLPPVTQVRQNGYSDRVVDCGSAMFTIGGFCADASAQRRTEAVLVAGAALLLGWGLIALARRAREGGDEAVEDVPGTTSRPGAFWRYWWSTWPRRLTLMAMLGVSAWGYVQDARDLPEHGLLLFVANNAGIAWVAAFVLWRRAVKRARLSFAVDASDAEVLS